MSVSMQISWPLDHLKETFTFALTHIADTWFSFAMLGRLWVDNATRIEATKLLLFFSQLVQRFHGVLPVS